MTIPITTKNTTAPRFGDRGPGSGDRRGSSAGSLNIECGLCSAAPVSSSFACCVFSFVSSALLAFVACFVHRVNVSEVSEKQQEKFKWKQKSRKKNE